MTVRFGKIRLGRQAYRLNALILSILFFGFFLTTATDIVDSSEATQVFRVTAIALALISIAMTGIVKRSLFAFLFATTIASMISLSQIAVNVVFLILIILSMSRLRDREAALALFIPTWAISLIHIALLQIGFLSESTYEVGDRVRSTFGFSNPNQLAVFYISFTFIACYAFMTFRSWRSLFFFLLAFAISFQFIRLSGSRTGFAIMIALLLIVPLWIPLSKCQQEEK